MSSNFRSDPMDFEKAVEQVAKKYTDEGYHVLLHPKGPDIPSFAADAAADLIATKGNEHVVVQVKVTRGEFKPETARYAELVNAQPGWRFDLVILEPESLVERIAQEAREPSRDQFEEILAKAEQSKKAGLLDAACVYAWAGLEAAMRRVASDLDLYGRSAPNELLRTLYSNGILSREEFDRLRESFKVRAAAVHGLIAQTIDPAMVGDVMAIARRLMESDAKHQAPAAG